MLLFCFSILRIELKTLSILDNHSTNWPTCSAPTATFFFVLVYSDTVSISLSYPNLPRQAPGLAEFGIYVFGQAYKLHLRKGLSISTPYKAVRVQAFPPLAGDG